MRCQLTGLLLGFALIAPVQAAGDSFRIAVLATIGDNALERAIADTDDDNLAFVVVNGIKAADAACSDAVYLERKILLDSAKNGVILSMAGSDWTACRNTAGQSIAMERLTRLRDLFFTGEFSFGASRIPLLRQSGTPKFRSYAENAHWEVGTIQFATINLPADNNHFLAAAGRNSEFEDRQIANHAWLQRLIANATHRKLAALVLFCDGNLMLPKKNPPPRDGFAQLRGQLTQLAAGYPGKVLLVHDGAGATGDIRWRDKVGTLAVGAAGVRLTIAPDGPALFVVSDGADRSGNKKAAVTIK
ncbi:hypothetical protein QN362_07515 [Actimicrobium sp. CCC2.4]|uniref:hypothetical protein n=1 Tax=Actimicrobium sp. CCC2.4 TaxID=3048606 RepID=UPI002AC939CF|nr:hypothetical protein [Actimicrobium sp. CCC2.4]MEB0135176.1 hypothetical protein [Actimicrobium sp. CCC2.4]WPX30974.1 hypothetical protein RHM62_11975 [Actimicrobium sp. CCC2.4]